MPSRSKSEQRAMAAAEHGATFPLAKKLRASLTASQLHDFASGSMKGKPEHVTSSRDVGSAGAMTQHHPNKNLGAYLHKKKS